MLPLKGIRVLDLTRLAPGPFCTMILGDFGAEVLSVEAPSQVGGRFDVSRRQPSEKGRREEVYNSLNRNKNSIAINLKTKQGRKIFYELAKTADVIVEGFRPGVVKRLGIDYKTISAMNSKIIYCSITGYGQKGPYSKLPGHDINYISLSGALSLITDGDGKPVIPLNLLGDFVGGGLYAVIGIITALFVRQKMGIGQYIDISMTSGVMSLLTTYFDYYFTNGELPMKAAPSGAYPYYNLYQTKDQKYLSIGCVEPWFWNRLCELLGKTDFADFHFSPDHLYRIESSKKWLEISNCLKKLFLGKTRDEWFELLAEKDIPVGKVYSLSEASSDPHLKHQEMIIEIKHPTKGKIQQVGIPVKLSKTKGKVRSSGPEFSEHTKKILKKLGYSRNEIEEFIKKGVVQ